MKRLTIAILAVVLVFFAGVSVVSPAMAENAATKEACGSGLDEVQKAALGCDQDKKAPEVAEFIINAVISLVGIIAVIMIVVGGQRYATSQGDPGQAKQAKDMILYSVVGLIIAMLAFAIVNFVLGGVFGGK